MTAISWTSTGIPAPQGSKRHVGRGIMIEANKALPAWREQVVYDVINAAGGHVFTEGVSINLAFQFPRLKAHFNSKGLLKPKAPTFKTTNYVVLFLMQLLSQEQFEMILSAMPLLQLKPIAMKVNTQEYQEQFLIYFDD